MQKSSIYQSITLHIAVFLLCVLELPSMSSKYELDNQPPIIVDLKDVKISDTTNIPEKAVIGEEKRPATRKEKPIEESFTQKTPEPLPEIQTKEEPKPEPIIETPEIKAPSLIEDAPKNKETREEPKKESNEPKKEKKKPAPIPAKKPQIKPNKKPKQDKKTTTKKTQNDTSKTKSTQTVKSANPLASMDKLMNSVDDLQKQIGTEDTPAQIPANTPVNNMGLEDGNSKGSYFSELSISGVDFVKSKIQSSWKTIAGGKDDRNIAVVINVKITKEGLIETINIEDKKRYSSDKYFQALADSAERAIYIAQDVHNVFKVLAAQNGSNYNDWKEIKFTFTPLGLSK